MEGRGRLEFLLSDINHSFAPRRHGSLWRLLVLLYHTRYRTDDVLVLVTTRCVLVVLRSPWRLKSSAPPRLTNPPSPALDTESDNKPPVVPGEGATLAAATIAAAPSRKNRLLRKAFSRSYVLLSGWVLDTAAPPLVTRAGLKLLQPLSSLFQLLFCSGWLCCVGRWTCMDGRQRCVLRSCCTSLLDVAVVVKGSCERKRGLAAAKQEREDTTRMFE